jgi:hypothetical protein
MAIAEYRFRNDAGVRKKGVVYINRAVKKIRTSPSCHHHSQLVLVKPLDMQLSTLWMRFQTNNREAEQSLA